MAPQEITRVTTVTAAATPLYRVTQFIWYAYSIIAVLLGLRFVLQLFAANPAAIFTDVIYRASAPLMAPFAAVFQPIQGLQGVTIEWATLLAIAVYWIVARAIIALVALAMPVSDTESTDHYREQHGISR